MQLSVCPATLCMGQWCIRLQLTVGDFNSPFENVFHLCFHPAPAKLGCRSAIRQYLLANLWKRSWAFKEGTDTGQSTSWKKAPGWRKLPLISERGKWNRSIICWGLLRRSRQQQGHLSASKLCSKPFSIDHSGVIHLESTNSTLFTQNRGKVHLQQVPASCLPLI